MSVIQSRQTLPVVLPPIRAGEVDGRFVDFTNDLGAVGDQIILPNTTITIYRRDGFPMSGADLALAGQQWPNSVDPANQILTIGLAPPSTAANIGYRLVVTIDKTLQGRLFIRDLWVDVLAVLG